MRLSNDSSVAQGKMHNVGKSALLSIGGVKAAVAVSASSARSLCLRAFRRRLTDLDIIVKHPPIAPISTQLRRRPSPPLPSAGMCQPGRLRLSKPSMA